MAKRVLIVDDEADIRTTLKQAVEGEGFEAKLASSAKEALHLLEKESFDLVLMDIFMPEMSGREAVEKIRKNKKLEKQKIAFITVANLSETGKKIIKRLKPADYIQKPIDYEEFVTRLRNLLK